MDNPWVFRFLNCIGPEPSCAGKKRRPVDTAKTMKWGKTFRFNEHTPLSQARPPELHDKAVLGHFHKPRWMRPENVERENEGQTPTRRYPIVSSLDEECLDTNKHLCQIFWQEDPDGTGAVRTPSHYRPSGSGYNAGLLNAQVSCTTIHMPLYASYHLGGIHAKLPRGRHIN